MRRTRNSISIDGDCKGVRVFFRATGKRALRIIRETASDWTAIHARIYLLTIAIYLSSAPLLSSTIPNCRILR